MTSIDDKLARIHEIDAQFENATGWGSWMATLSSERRCLVRELRAAGIVVDHRYELKTASGRLSD